MRWRSKNSCYASWCWSAKKTKSTKHPQQKHWFIFYIRPRYFWSVFFWSSANFFFCRIRNREKISFSISFFCTACVNLACLKRESLDGVSKNVDLTQTLSRTGVYIFGVLVVFLRNFAKMTQIEQINITWNQGHLKNKLVRTKLRLSLFLKRPLSLFLSPVILSTFFEGSA